jgi:glycosyltransferase involved in cell wall biosynthesis
MGGVMPLLSVITAVHSGRQEYLKEAAVTVLAQELPERWEMEWLVQEDFDEPEMEELVHEIAERDTRVHYAANRTTLGPGGTRNLALWRAGGDLVRTFDSDDLLLPEAIRHSLDIFREHSDVHWSAGRTENLRLDGTRDSYLASPLPYGYVAPGELNRVMLETGLCPIHCAGLTIRISTLRAAGGWVGLPVGEDVSMISPIAEIFPGWHDPAITWLYRRHPGQITNEMPYDFWRSLGETAAEQRITGLREILSNCPPQK